MNTLETKPRVLVIDDDMGYCEVLGQRLTNIFDTCFEPTLERGIAQMEAREPDVVLLDLKLPDSSKLATETLSRLKLHRRHAAIVVLSGHADPDTIYNLIQGNAAGFLMKGRDDEPDRIACEVQRAIASQRFANAITPAIKEKKEIT